MRLVRLASILPVLVFLGFGGSSLAQVPIFVLSQENQLLAVDAVSLRLLDAELLAGEIREMKATPDGSRILLASRSNDLNSGRIFFYDAVADGRGNVDLRPGQGIDLRSSPVSMALTPDGRYAHVTIGTGSLIGGPVNELEIYDLQTLQLVSRTTLSFSPGAIGISPDGLVSWIADPHNIKVFGFYRQSPTPFTSVQVNAEPAAVEVTPDNRWVLVANKAQTGNPFSRHTVSVIDAAAGTLAATISGFANPPTSILISADGRTAYIGASNSDQLTVVDIDSRVITGALTVGASPRGLQLTAGGLLFVANSGDNTLSVVDTATGNVAAGPYVFDAPVHLAGASRVDPSALMKLSRLEIDRDDPFLAELFLRRGLDPTTLVDLYYGVSVPGWGILYMREDGNYRPEAGPARAGVSLANENLTIAFGPLGDWVPLGDYIFFAVLTPPGVGLQASGAYSISWAVLRVLPSTAANVAPSGAITEPLDGEEVAGVIRVEGYALDDHQVDHIDVLLDGVVVGRADFPLPRLGGPGPLSSGWSFLLDLSGLASGAHTIDAVAVDDEGRVSGSLGARTVNIGSLVVLDFPWILDVELLGFEGTADPPVWHLLLTQNQNQLSFEFIDRHTAGTLVGALDELAVSFAGLMHYNFASRIDTYDLAYVGTVVDNEHLQGTVSGSVNGVTTSGTFTMVRSCYEWPLIEPPCED